MLNKMCKFLLVLGATVSLVQSATVSGTVKDSVSSTVIKGVTVQVRSGNQVIATDTTDTLGAFSLEITDTGRFTIRASLRDVYVTKSIDTTLSATPLTLDISIAKIIYTTVSGVVSDSVSGTALAGAIVRLGSRADTADANGSFSFDSVKSGNQTIQVTLSNYTSKSVQVAVISDPVTVNIPLAPVMYAKVSGIVSDSISGTAIAGAVVRLGSGLSGKTDTTSADGSFSFDSVKSGSQTIQVSFSSYTSKSVQFSVGSSEPVTVNVALAPVMYAKVSGTVTDSTAGTALAGVIVRLGSGSSAKTDTTSADGLFSFDSVKTGNQTIQVTLSGYNSKSVQFTIINSEPVTVNVALVAYATVSGVVTDSSSGAAVSGAIVSLGSGMQLVSDTTGADGAYSIGSVPRGTQTIQVKHPAYARKSVQVTISGSETVTANVQLVAITTATVSGAVTDSGTGTALSGVVVRIGNSPDYLYDTTGADGTYSISYVPEGKLPVKVQVNNYQVKRDSIEIAGTTPVTRNYQLVAILKTTVSGVVTDSATGSPLNGVVVRIGSSPDYFYDTTGADGAYSIADVPEGSLPVKVQGSDDYQVKRDTLKIAGSTPVTYNIKLIVKTAVKDGINLMRGLPNISYSAGIFKLVNISGSGDIKLFGLNGKLIYKRAFSPNSSFISLPGYLRLCNTAFIVQVSSGNVKVERKILSLK